MYYDRLCNLGIKITRRAGSEKVKCPQCSDSRKKNKADKPLSVNISAGVFKCHNCGWSGSVAAKDRVREQKVYQRPPSDVLKSIEIKEKAVSWFRSRGISEDTLNKFMIFTKEEWMPQTNGKENCICFPYFRDSELINIKFRDGRKNFKMVKDAELVLFGMQHITEQTKKCIIVEGEIDALSVYECGFGAKEETTVSEVVNEDTGEVIENENDISQYVVLSVPNGASSGEQKLEYIDNCSDWLMDFEEIIIATDGDKAGISLKDELVRRLGIEKCKTINYPKQECVPSGNSIMRPCKDFNEVLMYLGKEVLTSTILASQFIPVDGIYYLEDIFPSMIENFRNGIKLAPETRMGEMDEYFRWKKGEINLCTGYGNHGKTTFWLQSMLTKSIYDGWRWAVFSPENFPANDFFDDLVEMYAGKWLPKMTEKEYTEACEFINKHIFYVYPEDEHDIHSIHDRFRHLILKKGVDGVLVDPFNQLDHNQKAFQREDQYLSEVFKDIKRFCLLNGISYNIIAHPKSPSYAADRSMPIVDTYDLYGGSMWSNKMDNIISYYRPNYHIDKNDPHVMVVMQKIKRIRTGGKKGSFNMILNWSQKRYSDPVTGEVYCDPERAKKIKAYEKQNYIQPPLDEGWNQIPDIDF